MKTGIFGGTFNPPHNGHVRAAGELMSQLALDRLFVIPVNSPPHKTADDLAGDELRFAMCTAAFGELDNVTISRIEIDRAGKSYTYDTLCEFREMYPEDDFFLFIGSDMLMSFHKWYRYEDILKMCTLCVVSREDDVGSEDMLGYAQDMLGGTEHIVIINIKAAEMSSSEIRRKIKSAQTYSDELCEGVVKLIEERGLYRDGDK